MCFKQNTMFHSQVLFPASGENVGGICSVGSAVKDWSAWVSKLLPNLLTCGSKLWVCRHGVLFRTYSSGQVWTSSRTAKIFRCPPWRTVNLRLILPFIHATLYISKIHVSFIYVCVSARPVFNSYIKTFLSEVLGFLWFIFLEAYLKAYPTNPLLW